MDFQLVQKVILMQRKLGFGILASLALFTAQTGYSGWEDLVNGKETVFGHRTPVLSADEQGKMFEQFKQGKSYIHREPTGDAQCVWDRLTVFTLLDAPTDVAAAYLADFKVDKEAFPEDVESVEIVDNEFKNTTTPHVEFVVNLIPMKEHDGAILGTVKTFLNGFLGDKFTMQYRLESKVKDDETVYSIRKNMLPVSKWAFDRNKAFKRNEAYTYLEPFKGGEKKPVEEDKKQTLFVYEALMCPRLRAISVNFQEDVLLKADIVADIEKKNIETQAQVDIDRRVDHLHSLLGIK